PTTHVDTTLTPTEIPNVSPIIPPSLDYIPASPDYSPVSDTKSDPSEDSDAPHTPPSPSHGTTITKITPSTQGSPAASGALHSRVMILALGHPIPYGRPYHYHSNGSVHMITARKRVGPLPTHLLAMRHLVDYSSSDLFASNDSSRESPSDSSSETSSDSSLDDLSDSSSSHSSSGHSSTAPPSGTRSSHQLCSLVPSDPHLPAAITERPSHSSSVGLSHKRSRSPTTYVPLSSHIAGALSFARANILPPPKRIRSPRSVMDLEYCSDESSELYVPTETGLRVDVVVGGNDEPHSEHDIDLEGSFKVRVDRGTHPMVSDDIPEPTQEGAVEGADMSERIRELERDNTRLR
nr:hypothetical protein [Tanacetum cinerariifolium]